MPGTTKKSDAWSRRPYLWRAGRYGFFLLYLAVSTQLIFAFADFESPTLPEQPEAFKWGGWVAANYLADRSEEQGSFLGITSFYVYGDYSFSSKWQLFAEIEYEREPSQGVKHDGDIKLDRGYFEYRHATWLNFRLGKYNIPAGIWKDLHWAVLVDSISEPLMEANRFIPQHAMGLMTFGTFVDHAGEWHYDLMLNSDAAEGLRADGSGLNHSDHPQNFGFNLSRGLFQRLTVGGTFYYQSDSQNDHRAWMVYGDWNGFENRFSLRGEYLYFSQTNRETAESFYVQAKCKLGKKRYLLGRTDFADEAIFPDGEEHRVQTLTYGYQPSKQLRLRLEFSHNHLASGLDYQQWSGWASWVFQ